MGDHLGPWAHWVRFPLALLAAVLGVGSPALGFDDREPIQTPATKEHPVLHPMNNEKLLAILKRSASNVETQSPGVWTFRYGDRDFYLMTDESHNRMRTMTPVRSAEDLDVAELKQLLDADFDKALDARYALYRDVLWSVYIHPLRELGEAQFEDALLQVKLLADNYGGSYASSTLVFRGGQ